MARGDSVEANSLPVVGSDNAPVLLIDGYSGIVQANGIVRLRLVRSQMTDDRGIVQQCVGHLAMSVETIVSLHAGLTNFIEDLKADGVLEANLPENTQSDG